MFSYLEFDTAHASKYQRPFDPIDIEFNLLPDMSRTKKAARSQRPFFQENPYWLLKIHSSLV